MKQLLPRSFTNRWVAAAALSALVGGAVAQEYAGTDRLPEAQSFGDVSVISGGVDLGQAEMMRKAQSRYPLRIVYSVRGNGDYTVPDELVLMKGDETIAQLPSAGPWVLIDLPPGTYTLRSTFEGRVAERTVRVGREGQTVHWVAPQGID
jgi:hypothetical protein